MSVSSALFEALNGSSGSYHTRLQKGGALLPDMRLLVRSWKDEARGNSNGLTQTVLGKRTLARAKDTFTRAFAPRFLQGDPPNAWKLIRHLEDREADVEILIPVYYWITARSDRLLYDYVTQELVSISRSGDGSVRIEETVGWIRKQLKSTDQQWTPTVTVKVARGLLAALRDFKILAGANRKRVTAAHIPIESFCYIAFCLNKLGSSGEALVSHSDWLLFLLNQNLVERLFLEAHQRDFLSFQSAGRIYRIDFPAIQHTDYADLLIGKRS